MLWIKSSELFYRCRDMPLLSKKEAGEPDAALVALALEIIQSKKTKQNQQHLLGGNQDR